MGRDGLIGSWARYLHHCRTVGPEDAGRRLREERKTRKIRESKARGPVLQEAERKAQEAAAKAGGIRFRAVFLEKDVPEEARKAAEDSLDRQTWPAGDENADWVVFLEPDGWLHPAALYACARAAEETGADLVYTDEAYFTEAPGDRDTPYFKPDYGPDSLKACNYIGPFLACRRSLLRDAGAENYVAMDAGERWDAVIRMARTARAVCHVPEALYYRRVPMGEETPLPAVRHVAEPVRGEPLVSILIPNRDHREDLKRCLDSIREKTAYGRYEILVIENNSTEGETFRYYEELEADPRIRVITREGAFNYSAVNNAGFREARGEQILLLNNDTEVISPDWIREMLMFTQQEDVGAAGAKLYYPDGTIQHAGIGIGIMIAAGHYHRGFPGDSPGYFNRLRYAQEVSAVTGACMMIPRHVYEEMNGLDEGFSLMFNDVDLCLRIREAGYRILWTPWAELVHHESKSRGADDADPEKQRFLVRETNRFLRKWHRTLEAGDPYYNPNLTREREDFSLR